MNHTWPFASRIVKPGVTPSIFAAITRPRSGGRARGRVGPLQQLVDRHRRARQCRFVNQLESGTSSTVLTFWARTFGVGSPGFVSRFSSVS